MPHYRGSAIPGTSSRIRVRRRRNRTSKKKTSVAANAALAQQNRRDINRLKRELLAWRQYQQTEVERINTTAYTHLITDPSSWQGVFQAANIPTAEKPRQYNLKNVHLKYMVQCENNLIANLWFQVFIVSLKPKFAIQTRARTTNLTTFTEDDDYIASDAGTPGFGEGLCNFQLNPALYRVHHTSGTQRIGQETTGAGTPVTTIRDSTYWRTVTIPFKRTFKIDDHENGGFTNLNATTVLSQNMLFAVVLSNANASGEPTPELFFSMNAQHVGQTVQGE